MTTGEPGALADAVVVRIGEGRFAVALDAVAEVGRVPHCTRVPGMPAWLVGVANWRGRILPVLDLGAELGGRAAGDRAADARAAGSAARLLVLGDAGLSVGLAVDTVEGTTALTGVEPLPATLHAPAESLLCGQMLDPFGPVGVIAVPSVLGLRHRLAQGRRSA